MKNTFFSLLVSVSLLSACGQNGSISGVQIPSPAGTGADAPVSNTVGSPSTTAGSTTTTTIPTPTPIAPKTYASCVTNDPTHICIGLKLVSYENTSGTPVLTSAQASALVDGMNAIWSTCNIAYQLEEFEMVNPADYGLTYNSNWEVDGDTIRSKFQNSTTFLVVTLGTLSGSTIGVTKMPGGSPYGSLIEGAYANNALTVGHELGHYQGLYHISDTTNLMNPYIGADTKALTTSQCATARSADTTSWKAMLRQ